MEELNIRERVRRAIDEPHKMRGSDLWTEVRVDDLAALLSSAEAREEAERRATAAEDVLCQADLAVEAAETRAQQAEARVEELQGALLYIAERDWHYRKPPAPKPDGGMRGWAGQLAVSALTGLNGSFNGDAEVRQALQQGEGQ